MTDKSERLSERLVKVRENIEDSKRLIAYHKKMLKTYKRKDRELSDKLEREKFNALYKTVREGGCDISAIKEAIKNGEFSAEGGTADSESPVSAEQKNEEDGQLDNHDNIESPQNNTDFHKNREDKNS